MSDESPIKFPCDFVVKVMGAATEHFENVALDIAKRHASKIYLDKISKKKSQKGDYISLTLTVHFENRAQMDALYKELQTNPEVLMAL